MRRLVYAPKAFVYVKNSAGSVLDLTKYTTAGTVSRKINQVSTAQVRLRNPNMIFTTTGANAAQAFTPMDPITIYLMRVKGRPVRVFTGFLDKIPYYEMYPGTITLNASCTIKKLLYTFFDPALPYAREFLTNYGWLPDPAGKGLYNPGAFAKKLPDDKKDPRAQLTDGSIGNLLYATMKHIGNWDPSNIYIEQLPKGIVQRMALLYKKIDTANKLALDESTKLFGDIIGQASFGSGGAGTSGGGTSTGNIKGADKIVPVVVSTANHYNVPARMILAMMIIETGLGQNMHSSGSSYYGWIQGSIGGCYRYGPWRYGSGHPTMKEAYDLGLAVNACCACCVGWANSSPSLRNDIHAWIMKVQGVNTGNNPLYATEWPHALSQADALITKFGHPASSPSGSSGSSGSGSSGGSSGGGRTQTTHKPIISKVRLPAHPNRPGAYHGSTGGSSTSSPGKGSANPGNPYVAPFRHMHASLSRTDQGVDFAGSGRIDAIGDCTITGITPVAQNALGGGGPFLIYQLTSGPQKGAYIFIAEQHRPSHGVGTHLNAGDQISTMTGHIEMGYAKGPTGAWNPIDPYGGRADGTQTEGGKRFARLLRSLGQTTAQDPGPGPMNSTVISGTINFGGGSSPAAGGGGGSSSSPAEMASIAKATAFATQLEWPSIEETIEAIGLQGQKSLMNDKPLMPFVQQLTDASLRQFQSLPNGDFFAFYPDYFGEFNHRKPYWLIDDVEILDGRIELSDEALATHVYTVGQTLPGANDFINKLASGGVINIFNMFGAQGVLNRDNIPQPGGASAGALALGDYDAAVNFLKRYGARPLLDEEPFIRSPYFEAFKAYQTFMLMWSRQFVTTFTFTFMPELYPGGHVGFPDHGLQMYIEEVEHSWDYTSGFTTQANLSAPAVMTDLLGKPLGNSPLPPNMIMALAAPSDKLSDQTVNKFVDAALTDVGKAP